MLQDNQLVLRELPSKRKALELFEVHDAMTPDDKSGGVYGAASYVQRILQKIVNPLIFTVDEGGDTSPGVPVQAAAPSAQVARELECPVVAPIFSVIDPLSSVLAEPFWEESYDSNAVP
ncbi:hypothetical protein THAOC_20672 [Thalassiosira oceanica]|uniref:Uncharacterized protein n=1 Tax=Thalassiosira oceanica TaxID=159749 RepID=K0RZC9_THAOC|nr:hypothetical protein THAOC_20672 [Thalassiosira oceanica]|eukprot:EJK59143.1 hypothetical protein THAOC_20672 [Thalassiosira oceanica]